MIFYLHIQILCLFSYFCIICVTLNTFLLFALDIAYILLVCNQCTYRYVWINIMLFIAVVTLYCIKCNDNKESHLITSKTNTHNWFRMIICYQYDF